MHGILERLGDAEQIIAVAALFAASGDATEMVMGNIAKPERDLLGAGDAEPLALLKQFDVLARLEERGVRAGIEPSEAAAHHFDEELVALHVNAVHVGDLKLAARGRRKGGRDLDHAIIVKIQPRNRM